MESLEALGGSVTISHRVRGWEIDQFPRWSLGAEIWLEPGKYNVISRDRSLDPPVDELFVLAGTGDRRGKPVAMRTSDADSEDDLVRLPPPEQG